MKIVQGCKDDKCENEPVLDIKIGNETHNFCCQRGFEKGLEDFSNYLKKNP